MGRKLKAGEVCEASQSVWSKATKKAQALRSEESDIPNEINVLNKTESRGIE